jgi:sugar (pentulose or hexulose) kinase
VAGAGLLEEGEAVVSLGTSDTFLLLLPESFVGDGSLESRTALPFGHAFPHPILANRYFLMLCYSNGDVGRKVAPRLLSFLSSRSFSSTLKAVLIHIELTH